MSTTSTHSRPISITLVTIFSAILGLGSIYGGTALIADPTGGTLTIPVDLIAKLPVSDYLLIGIFLISLGLASVVGVVGLWRNFSWGWPLALVVSLVMTIWTLIGFSLIGLHFSHQPIVLLLSIWNIYLLWRPSSLKYALT